VCADKIITREFIVGQRVDVEFIASVTVRVLNERNELLEAARRTCLVQARRMKVATSKEYVW
jgi:hypothetical protein